MKITRFAPGFSLLELTVTTGLIGVISLGASQAFLRSRANEKGLNAQSSVESLRRWVRLGMDCEQTMDALPGTCSASPVAVLQGNGSALVTAPAGTAYTTREGYQLQTTCTGTDTKAFTFQMRKVGAADWKPLFDTAIPRVCRKSAPPPHGNLLVVLYTYNGSTALSLATNMSIFPNAAHLARLLPTGELDTSYGVGGKVLLPYSVGYKRVNKLHLLPDKSVLAIGMGEIVKVKENGTIDTTYGTSGIKTLPAGGMRETSEVGNNRIYSAWGGGANWCQLNIEALDFNGNRITTFGTSGLKQFRNTTTSDCSSSAGQQLTCLGGAWIANLTKIVPLASGKVLFAGRGMMIRVNANGTLDTTFGGATVGCASGGALIGISSVQMSYAVPYSNYFNTPVVEPAGTLWLVSGVQQAGMATAFGERIIRQRVSADGVLDTSYGSTSLQFPGGLPEPGVFTTPGMVAEVANINGYLDQVFRLSTGKYLVPLMNSNAQAGNQTMRFNADTTIDTTYGTNGAKMATPHVVTRVLTVTSTDQPILNEGHPTLCRMRRLNTDGSDDPTWIADSLGCNGGVAHALEIPN